MVTAQSSTPDSCAYCGDTVESEQAYRRHLHDAHDPSELGAIDRRRYEAYGSRPGALHRMRGEVRDGLDGLNYPVDGVRASQYALYGFVSSLIVAMLLGVGV